MKYYTYYLEKNYNKYVSELYIYVYRYDTYGFEIKYPHIFLNKSLKCTITIIDDIIIWDKILVVLRRSNMSTFKKAEIKEEQESFSNDDLFNINSWGADLSFRELIAMYDENDLIKPELQRKYVWSLEEASRLIDSILLGLPIPSIFLAKKEEKRLIIDGYQRIKTVYDYVKGIFSKDDKIFKLSNSKIINQRWRGKSFIELTEDEQRRIKNTTIHAIIFEQKKPNNDSGMFQIFERINTSGRTLYPQEIRNCIYQGNYNRLLMELNKNEIWRRLLNCNEDTRMNDVENILRYFAIKNLQNTDDYYKKQIVLKKFLNENMALNCNLSTSNYEKFSNEFIKIIYKVYETLGETAFNNVSEKKDDDGNIIFSDHFVKKFHPTIYEAIMLAFEFALRNNKPFENMKQKQLDLLNDIDFRNAATIRTTNIENIKKRVSIATRFFFGEEYDWR